MSLLGSAQQDLDRLGAALTTAAVAAPAGTGDEPIEAAPAVAAAIDTPDGAARTVAGTIAPLDPNSHPDGPGAAVDGQTLFDLASMTKLVTALTAAVLVEDGRLDVEAPVAEMLEDVDPRITVRQLLTHTAGLPPTLPLWRVPGGREERLAAVRRCAPPTAPGTAHVYSCVGFLLLGALLEGLTDTPLPELARRTVLDPAGAGGITWAPLPEDMARTAPTEVQTDPPRGLVRGTVHDEAAWSVGGAGNAGAFARLQDAVSLGRVLAGRSEHPRLSPTVRRMLVTDQLPAGVSTHEAWAQGLGPRVGQELPSGRMLPHLVGHPGFTGTSLLAEPRSGTVAVLLTNRVHPRREAFTVAGARREMARIAWG